MEEARNISIFENEGYDEVIIHNSQGREVARYILRNRNSATPVEIPEGGIEIKVPVESLATDSEVYAAALIELGVGDVISGMFDEDYVTIPSIRKGLDTEEIEKLGKTSSPNLEKLIALGPDAMLISYFDGMQTQNLEGIGIPVVKMYDLQELTPEGRAEWIRFFGKLTGKDAEAELIYQEVRNNYSRLAEKGKNGANHPKVLTDLMYQGVWYVPGGNSYQAELLKDAGADYFMKNDNSAITLNLSPEQILSEASDADIWIIRHYGSAEELRTILEADPVYRNIKAYKTGRVYYSDTSRSGLFRDFPFHPDLLLEDYYRIFNGEDIENLKYFKRLE